jgi:plasmid stabilization system protein ParE
MVTSLLKVIWTNKAKSQLKEIYEYYKIISPLGAKNVKNDILRVSKELVFSKQYQQDEIEPEFRRIPARASVSLVPTTNDYNHKLFRNFKHHRNCMINWFLKMEQTMISLTATSAT